MQRVISLWTPWPLRLWRAARIAYLRFLLWSVKADLKYESESDWPNVDQLALYRRSAQALRVQITLLENTQ